MPTLPIIFKGIKSIQNSCLTDRIIVKVSANESLESSFNEYKTYICAEILADSLEFLPQINDGNAIEINESIVNVNVIKKGA